MLDVLWWFLGTTLIGWLFFPLTWRIFPILPSRGYALARVMGLLIWGYFFWMFTALGVLENNLLSQCLILGVLIFLSIFIGFRSGFKEIWQWFMINWHLVLGVELVFLVAFCSFAIFRAASPAIVGTEKPMELTFLNGILRSETFPPHDPWLSGHSISYYYFGYLLVVMLTRLAGTTSAVAFNLAQALWFALIAASAYGLLVDFFAIKASGREFGEQNQRQGHSNRIQKWMLRFAVLAPVLCLLLGNAFGFLDVLHARGILWGERDGVGKASTFWAWVDVRGLNIPPAVPFDWVPEGRGTVPWWHASRVLQDVTYAGKSVEVIDEFPNFSFVLGDLHPHILAMPFVLMSIALALNAFSSPKIIPNTTDRRRRFNQAGRFLLVSGLIGSLAFLNTWDWPIYAALYSIVFLIQRSQSQGWHLARLVEFVSHGLGMAALGYLLYLPFFLNFSSQAAGFLPSVIYFTRGIHFWVMFGPLLCLVGFYLIWIFRHSGAGEVLEKAALWVGGLILLLVLLNILVSMVAIRLEGLGDLFMANQGAAGMPLGRLLWEAFARRITQPGTWLTLSGMLILSLSVILIYVTKPQFQLNHLHIFVILLILWGGLLAFLPEFVYLLDQFGKRMNTIFKFYFQTWILWSLGGAFFLGEFWQRTKFLQTRLARSLFWALIAMTGLVLAFTSLGQWVAGPRSLQHGVGLLLLDGLWILWGLALFFNLLAHIISQQWLGLIRILVVFSLSLGLFYPLLAIPQQANGFQDPNQWTLDGSQYYRQINPDLMDAVDWLWEVQPGVLAEAVGPDGGDYSFYGRVSMLSGVPTVLGWGFHERQWRGGEEEIGNRQADVVVLYETHHWAVAQGIIDKYNIEYVYIGDLERKTYQLQEAKFEEHLDVAFQTDSVRIYHTNLD